MVLPRRLGSTAIAFALLLVAAGADALTLGRPRGAVILGRPLHVTITATLAPGEPELCAQAELLQGDARTGQLDVTIERAEGAHVIRLRSAALIEEPFVTVYLRTGCGQQFTKAYVLLADLPQDTIPLALAPAIAPAPPATTVPQQPTWAAPAAAALPGAAAPTLTAGLPPRAATALPQPAREQSPHAAPAHARRQLAASRVAAAKPAPARRPSSAVAATPAATSARPRLTLEPIDASAESASPLNLVLQLAIPSIGTRAGADAERAAATAAPSNALSSTAEALAAQSRRSEAMEAELKSLRDAMQRNTQGMALLAAQLENARAERNFANISLAVLASVLAAGMIFMLWLRTRDSLRQQARWQGMVRRQSELDATGDVDAHMHGSMRSRAASRPTALEPLAEFAQSEVGNPRLPGAEELIDIRQKVDYFVAQGQHAQAVELLEAQIQSHLGSSPLVWLGLLDIYQGLGRREDHERIRAGFQTAFAARLPAFDALPRESAGLEDYPDDLSRICLLWPSPRVLHAIEELLFGHPHQPSAITFDLNALHDLLLLYRVAKEVTHRADGVLPSDPPLKAGETHPPLSKSVRPMPLAALDQAPEPPAEVAPDIDLDFLYPGKQEMAAEAPAIATDYSFDLEPRTGHTT